MNDVTPIPLLFCSGVGQADTRAPVLSDGRPNPSSKAGSEYDGVTLADVVALVREPPSVPKEAARWFLPSTYCGPDARSHARQREAGAFHWLVVDVDKGRPPLESVTAAVRAVLGDVTRLVYATRSATADCPKWRVLVPLQRPLTGADYADYQAALFVALGRHGLDCDPALTRPGQLVYLPNRGSWYQHDAHKAERLALTRDDPLTRQVAADRRARQAAECETMTRRAQRLADRMSRGEEVQSPVDWFNARNDLAALLSRYGWTPAPGERDWRSPFQTTRSFGTRVMGEGLGAMWVSLSSSDAGQGFGITTKTGAMAGDAFDLFAHFEHGGDMNAALREIGDEMRQEAGPLGSDTGSPRAGADAQAGAEVSTDGQGTRKSPSVPQGWPEPDSCLLSDDRAPPPVLNLSDVLTLKASDWVAATAEGAGAPADYVLAALLSVTGATMGNARWVSPWQGWAEPPVIWTMCIGNPSAGKSPAIDAVVAALRRAERPLREAAEAQHAEWEKSVALAKLAKAVWEKKAVAAIEKGNLPPPLPDVADAGAAPHVPRLVVNDVTVERLGVIVKAQPKGVLQMRDELAGWLLAMEARNGGSDRAFWLEAFGGRGFTVERMGRLPLTIDRLLIGVMGGIQPDRLSQLLLKAKDDGLLARFMPVWPARVPPRQPSGLASDVVADAAMARLVALDMPTDESGELRPWFVHFDESAQAMMNAWRAQCAEWETGAEGLLLSFIGKLPGMAARLALVLAGIEYAFDDGVDPRTIGKVHFGRACHFIAEYALPMARRAYAAASVTKEERAARVLLTGIIEKGWRSFDTRQAMRDIARPVLGTAERLAPALRALEEADAVRLAKPPTGPRGGRPAKAYDVNPALWGPVA